jgi:hypothetical protein
MASRSQKKEKEVCNMTRSPSKLKPLHGILIFILGSFLWATCPLVVAGTDSPEEENFKKCMAKAEQGEAKAQAELADRYLMGRGATKNPEEAAKWYRKAAEQGLPDAQSALGALYASGFGVSKDPIEAVKWYRLAATQGLGIAQYNLGAMYLTGQGVPQSDQEAMKWFRKASEQGEVLAQYNLAGGYFEGKGVPQSLEEAVKWLLKAAEKGHAPAEDKLGVLYAQGKGVTKDMNVALQWFRKAAAKGYKPAEANLKRFEVDTSSSKLPGQPLSAAVQTGVDCLMASSAEAFHAAVEATKLRDKTRWEELAHSGRVIMVPKGTQCEILKEIDATLVLVKLKGKEGQWVTLKGIFDR